ncbi:MAG: DUF4870 domain-containing protein [Parcubacteria group bacterium]|nr:DUF4870 domain-containing protein [Parcubacteria group bacterium]
MKHANISDFDRLLAAVSYVWILFVIPYVLGHKKPFVYRHARQGLALFVLELIIIVVAWVPILGLIVGFLGWIFVMVCAVIGIAHALAGKDWQIPFLHRYIDPR